MGAHSAPSEHSPRRLRWAGWLFAMILVAGISIMAINLTSTSAPAVGTQVHPVVTPQASSLFQKPQVKPQQRIVPIPVRTYTVARGDCLWRIAHKELGNGSEWTTLASVNHLSYPYVLQPGQVLAL